MICSKAMNKIKYHNLGASKETQEEILEASESEDETTEKYFAEDPKIFILNNLLMSIQFFESYEREIENLRETWYKEIYLQYHHKKCFNANLLFKAIGTQVKFQPRHGVNKGTESLLHPLRIFISDNNVQAAYDPAIFKKGQFQIKPFYQLTVKPCDDNTKEKSGYVSLVEFKTIEPQTIETPTTKTSSNEPPLQQSTYLQRDNEIFKRNSILNLKKKSTNDIKNSRALTKTEKLIGLTENKNLIASKYDKNSKFFDNSIEETIPNDGFYHYLKPEARLRFTSIHDTRMNNVPQTSIKIPKSCFQTVDVKKNKNSRRRSANVDFCFTTRNYLNSAAYKAHFCDLLIEKLAMPLCLNPDSLNESVVLEECIAINQKGIQNYITPVISILDWSQHVVIFKKLNKKKKELEWPTDQMIDIINILPCYLVPKGYFRQYEENVDYEKEWKIIFPKAEEFLLLHMMHSQLRCYFFILTIYKTFFEYETNPASFGPNHLLHLLLWLVHKDFLAWPEDRPGETLLKFFRILYKKLQNKSLRDFFINQRNLFHDSLLKDLHKAQAIVKRILENPLLYVMRAIKNLHLQPDFYPMLDVTKINEMLKNVKPQSRKTNKRERIKAKTPKPQEGGPEEKIQKTVRFENEDTERQWKKNVMKQINLEKKIEEKERFRSMSIETIDIEEFPGLALDNTQRFQLIETFINHFLQMGAKSVEYKTLNQAMMYLSQIHKLIILFPVNKSTIQKLRRFEEKMVELKQKCDKLISNSPITEIVKGQIHKKHTAIKEVDTEPEIKIIERRENVSISSKNSESDEEYSTKL